jgi:hypothetical protein
MKRSLLAALLLAVALGPGCKTAAPPLPPSAAVLPEPFGDYLDELRILRDAGDDRTVRVRPGKTRAGGCDLGVHVRSVTYHEGTARFALDVVGLPKVDGRPARCKRAQPSLVLLIEGLGSGEVPEVRARVDAVLQTPEAYLESKGTTFDRPAAEASTDIASRLPHAGDNEQRRGRLIIAWPRALLSVDPWYHDPSGRVHQEGEVEVEAVVGTDGRVDESRVRTGMAGPHEGAVLRVLPLWRFEPARREKEAAAARILLKPVLRVY